MRTFSRWMPKTPQQPLRTRDRIVIAALAAAILSWLAWMLYREPWVVTFLIVAFVVFVSFIVRRSNVYLRRLAAARVGEDICTFTRAFDRHATPFDPWVARAVWETLQSQLVVDGAPVPIRPTDRIVEDLQLDWESLDDDVEHDVAPRTGRTLDRIQQDPLFGRVKTVGDLVCLLSAQPLAMRPDRVVNQ